MFSQVAAVMASSPVVPLLLFFMIVDFSICQLSDDREKLLNWCLNSITHKHKPGKEDTLHEQCSPWKDHACCTDNTARDIHEINMYNFTFDHCSEQTGKNMSDACRQHFIQDNCFYHCEPHIGVWVVETKRKIAKERFHKVPLCASDCDRWFEDCKNDYTCAYNWPRDFKFKQGHNTCKEDATCMTFKDMYRTSKAFCESVWDESWKYTKEGNEEEPCMHVWFDGPRNPNKKVAEFYIKKYLNSASSISISLWFYTFAFFASLKSINLL